MTQHIAITFTDAKTKQQAIALSAQLHLDFIDPTDEARLQSYDFLLLCTPQFLGIQKTSDPKQKPFYIDFASGKLKWRRDHASLRKEALTRTLGVKPKDNPLILDTTAGLGRDSFIMASLGYRVIMLERSPIVHALLQDALMRAALLPELRDICARLTLAHANAIDWLHAHAASMNPTIIYIDPMFKQTEQKSAVKKDIALLQALLNHHEAHDADELLTLALTCSAYRVVVKRHRLAPTLLLRKRDPDFSVIGKSSRFDVYQMT